MSYHNRKEPAFSKIRSLLFYLSQQPSKRDQTAPLLEYWIEHVLYPEHSVTTEELVSEVESGAWDFNASSYASAGHVARFLKEFRDCPHRSERAKSFVTQLCTRWFLWFGIASLSDGDLRNRNNVYCRVSRNGGYGFISAASFVGHLVEWGLLDSDLVRQHLVKPLICHLDNNIIDRDSPAAFRTNAIYQLFVAAGNALLQGLLEPDDVEACLTRLGEQSQWIDGFDEAKLKVTSRGFLHWVR